MLKNNLHLRVSKSIVFVLFTLIVKDSLKLYYDFIWRQYVYLNIMQIKIKNLE